MSLLTPLPSNAPKKWIKQEVNRIKAEIQRAQELIKDHAVLREEVGISLQRIQNELKISQGPKVETKDSWGVKLSYSVDVPKKRGRPRKTESDANQTRIVFYRNLPNP